MASQTLKIFRDKLSSAGLLFRPDPDMPWLVSANAAIDVLDDMKNTPLAILGGDLWRLDQKKYIIFRDWFCEKEDEESHLAFADRSRNFAANVLLEVKKNESNEYFVDLVVCDSVTGEFMAL